MTSLVLLRSPDVTSTNVNVSDTASLSLSGTAGGEVAVLAFVVGIAASDTVSIAVTDSGIQNEILGPTGLFLLFTTADPNTVPIAAADTVSLSVSEDPFDSFDIVSFDVSALSLTEVVTAPSIAVSRGDTASLSVVDLSSVNKSGATAVNATDTASLTAAEATLLSNEYAVTDTASISVSDVGAAAVGTALKDATDTASLSAADFAAIDASTSLLLVNVTDSASLSLIDEGFLVPLIGELIEAVTDQARLSLTETAVVGLQGRPVARVVITARIPRVTIH